MSTETREPRGEIDDVPVQAIARDEILEKIKSTDVNHLGLVKASGTLRQILPIGLPWIPDHEFSGIVEEIGSDVASYAPGDELLGTSRSFSGVDTVTPYQANACIE